MMAFEIRKDFRQEFQALQDCVSKDARRPNIGFIHHDKERKKLVATTGITMLIWDIPQTDKFEALREFLDASDRLVYQKGYLMQSDSVFTFPSWWKAVPDTSKGYEQVAPILGLGGGRKEGAVQLFGRIIHAGMRVRFDRLEALGQISFPDVYIPDDHTRAVVAERPGMKFVIMPLVE